MAPWTRLFCLLCLTSSLQVLVAVQEPQEEEEEEEGHCQDRYGLLPVESFNHRACAMCYAFIFPVAKDLTVYRRTMSHLVFRNASNAITSEPLAPDVTNATIANLICSTLEEAECEKWRACCTSALECCERQRETPRRRPEEEGYCERTWDGYSCWDDTSAGVTATVLCPSYVTQLITDRRAIKQCTENGTWYTKAHLEWTDYTPCLNKEGYILGVYICLGCSVTSLLLLLPAIGIFLVFRDLRNQHRIKLHVHFFMSLTLAGFSNILWFGLVHYDLLVTQNHTTTVIYQNPVWCRLLSFMKIYLTATNYFWMFGEGYFLHRLISNAFEPPKSLIPIYMLGWVLPLLPAVAYAIARTQNDNTSCWAISLPGYQWIIYVPNFFCLFANLIFLCHILRILLFQLHAHPHEPSNFRRGLKAAFMLVPLFGLHTFVTIYRPPAGYKGEKEWEYVTFLITYLQGAFVALIYCFFNGEVLSHFQKMCPMLRRHNDNSQSRNFTQVTVCDRLSPTASLKSSRNDSIGPQNGTLLSNGKKDISYELSDMSGKSDSEKKSSSPVNVLTPEKKSTSPMSGGYSPVPTIVTS